MKKSFEETRTKKATPSKIATMAEYTNSVIERVILARKNIPAYVDTSMVMHAGIKRPVW